MNTTTNGIAAVRELTGDELAQVGGGLMPVEIDEMSVRINVSDGAHVSSSLIQQALGH